MQKEPWYFLDTGPGDYDFNMALDEALLHAMSRLGRPVLRFYGWNQSASSFGYFQKYSEVEGLTRLRPLVRRPTAGGIVPHQSDWTYSLTFPPSHYWYSLSAKESYYRVHAWIQQAFAALNVPTELAASRLKIQPGECFVGHEDADLLWHGRKIAGAAQRRNREGLLIQGSVQTESAPTERTNWQREMLQFGEKKGVEWISLALDEPLERRAHQLSEQKYSRDEYNRKR